MTIDELLGEKKQTYLTIIFTEEERDTMLSMLAECQQEAKDSPLHSKLRFIEQHVRAFFSRGQNT
jgi:hypothetical protein